MLKQENKKYFHSLYTQLEDLNPNDSNGIWQTISKIKRIKEIPGDNPISFEEWTNILKNYFKLKVIVHLWEIHSLTKKL